VVGDQELAVAGNVSNPLTGSGVQLSDRDRFHVTQRDTSCARGQVHSIHSVRFGRLANYLVVLGKSEIHAHFCCFYFGMLYMIYTT
jgi:hypothetical protein